MAGNDNEPSPRWAPASAPVEGQLLVWGGHSRGLEEGGVSPDDFVSAVYKFDSYLETWTHLNPGGPPPTGRLCACASAGHYLYTFGGEDPPTGSLYQLDTATSVWTELPANKDGPMKKDACGMVVHEDSIVLFGGEGIPSGPIQPGSDFIENTNETDGSGWTNELHIFNLKKGTWSSPVVGGARPPPCAGFTLTVIADNSALLIGGGTDEELLDMHVVYIIDLKRMHWSKLDCHEGPCPVVRAFHTAVCLGYGDHPQLLLYGGMDGDHKVLSDVWILDVESRRWREVKRHGLQPRWGHCMASFSRGPDLEEVVIFGGSTKNSNEWNMDVEDPFIGSTTLLWFESNGSTGDWILTGVADSTKLGGSQRIREKMVKMQGKATRSSTGRSAATLGAERRGRRELEEGVQAAETRARVAEERARESEQLVQEVISQGEERDREAERRVSEMEQCAEERVGEAEQRAEERVGEAEQRAEERVGEAERRAQEVEQRALTAEQRCEQRAQEAEQCAEERVGEAEQRAQEAEQRARASEERAGQVERQWVVERGEIHITEEVLGGGGWGEVKVAEFRGTRVAAKSLYQAIGTGRYYRQLFIREMNMAARIRHPNLVQFIGACMEGGMVILTELLPTSLRKELEREDCHMTPHQLISIGLDVARALSYLHQMQPDPVIHRDISSANILLEPLANQQWRAKVTDYGSVNFQQQLRTEGPGSAVYAAPEACRPSLQSPKMDIFSFGVLLVEMCTAEFPEVSARGRLIASIRDGEWVQLIRRCTHQSPEHRPSAAEVIAELQQRLED